MALRRAISAAEAAPAPLGTGKGPFIPILLVNRLPGAGSFPADGDRRMFQRLLTSTNTRIDLVEGGGQVPFRHAVRIGLGRQIASREILFHSILWGLGVGLFNALLSPPQIAPPIILGSLILAFGTGYTCTIPWRWKLAGGGPATRLLLNGLLSFTVGYLVFFASYLGAFLLFNGRDALRPATVAPISFVSLAGFVYTVLGFYFVAVENIERRERRARRASAYHERLAEQARIVALRAQINPHFFFNALNTIAALIPGRPADAERAVELLATALRPVLMREQPMRAPLESELTVARAYAEIEQLRLGDRVTFRHEIDADTPSCEVPSLFVQPLIENAVRHGAAESNMPWRISLRSTLRDGDLHLEVGSAPADMPPGDIDAAMEAVSFASGHALENISLRLRSLFGERATLSVRTHPDSRAAIVHATIPQEPLQP